MILYLDSHLSFVRAKLRALCRAPLHARVVPSGNLVRVRAHHLSTSLRARLLFVICTHRHARTYRRILADPPESFYKFIGCTYTFADEQRVRMRFVRRSCPVCLGRPRRSGGPGGGPWDSGGERRQGRSRRRRRSRPCRSETVEVEVGDETMEETRVTEQLHRNERISNKMTQDKSSWYNTSV